MPKSIEAVLVACDGETHSMLVFPLIFNQCVCTGESAPHLGMVSCSIMKTFQKMTYSILSNNGDA